MSPQAWRNAAIALAAFILALGGYQLLGPEDQAPAPTVKVQPTTGPPIVAKKATVDQAKQKLKATELGDHAGEKSETVGAVTLQRQSTQAKRGTTGPDSPTPIAQGASFSQPGCRTIPVGNYSSRGSQRPGLAVLHYTVSSNRPGWGDVLAVVSLFNNARYQASSNYVIDREGHCAYIVAEAAKAWTQGNMNGASACSIEMIGNGTDNGYQGAGLARAGQVLAACTKRWGIPVRAGATSGCSITRTGIVDHNELACGNNHTDIRPYSVPTVIAAARGQAPASSQLVKVEREVATKRCYHRAELVAGRDRAENLKWARHYRARILIPDDRSVDVGGHRQLVPGIDAAKRADGKPWSYRHRGARRAELLRVRSGKGC